MTTTAAHDEKETLAVDVKLPAHAERTTTPLFRHTRQVLIQREGGRCWICGKTAEASEHPLEAHHHPIERCVAEIIDFDRVRADCEAGHYGPYAQAFDWSTFDGSDPYLFVDDMRVNGLLLCKNHHPVGDEGIHTLPGPLWLAQRYIKAGVQYTPTETICHAEVISNFDKGV